MSYSVIAKKMSLPSSLRKTLPTGYLAALLTDVPTAKKKREAGQKALEQGDDKSGELGLSSPLGPAL